MNARTTLPTRYRETPDVIRLPARAGDSTPGAQTVRIFLGTEDGQWRAERIFVYAVEQVRDPAREYEIHLMKNLAGFDRRRWRTGFTNYRFAIPELAGGHGRAIYNDVDQIYLEDPAKLFDLPLDGSGYLSVSAEDTSVMLLDCGAMRSVWNLEAARTCSKSELLASAMEADLTWHPLDGRWNARDTEYPRDQIRLLHYTALHLQPWRPFPETYSYHYNPVGDLWFDLERRADAEGYQVFTRNRPSRRSQRLPASFARIDDRDDEGELRVGFDLSNCVPGEDIPWVLDELFRSARNGVSLSVLAVDTVDDARVDVQRTMRTPDWWHEQVIAAARRHRCQRWHLETRTETGTRVFEAKPVADPPTVWLLEGHRRGDNQQLRRIAEALGWPYKSHRLHYNPLHMLPGFVLGASRAAVANPEALKPPWPDLLITSGKRSAPVARWIKQQSGNRTQLVCVGRPWSRLDSFDLILTTPQYRLPARPNIEHLLLPITSHPPGELQRSSQTTSPLALPRPHIAVLVGGNSTSCAFTTRAAGSLGRLASRLARERNGSLLVSGSPRTPKAAFRALIGGISVPNQTWEFGQQSCANPYREYLATADEIIVTGDSVSMLADALNTGKPVRVFPLPPSPLARLMTIVQAPVTWLRNHRRTYRGTPKQQGPFARAYDRLVILGILTPPRDLRHLHEVLANRKLINCSGQPAQDQQRLGAAELDRALERIRGLSSSGREVRDS